MSRTQQRLEALHPGTVTIEGTDYACAVSGARQTIELTDGGTLLNCDIVFRVRKSLLPAAPAVGVQVTWEGEGYRVMLDPTRVRGHQQDVAWYLGCNAAME